MLTDRHIEKKFDDQASKMDQSLEIFGKPNIFVKAK
jgi:hypothetical protein